jgi:hypothetical protein
MPTNFEFWDVQEMDAEGKSPREPGITLLTSDKMSPNLLVGSSQRLIHST